METLKNAWKGLTKFLTEYNFQKVSDVIRKMEWHTILANPIVWLATVALAAYIIWKQQWRLLIMLASAVFFILLLQETLPLPGQEMSLDKIIQFIGGAAILVGVNAYFFLVRD